eukprot:12407488-Karenia_brevis.AAC.1
MRVEPSADFVSRRCTRPHQCQHCGEQKPAGTYGRICRNCGVFVCSMPCARSMGEENQCGCFRASIGLAETLDASRADEDLLAV